MKNDDGGPDRGEAGTKLVIASGMAMAAVGVALEITPAVVGGAIVLAVGIAWAAGRGGARGSSGGGAGPPVSAGSSAGSGSDSAGGTPSAPCFVAGTLVTLGDGSRKAIEAVEVGDLVLSQR